MSIEIKQKQLLALKQKAGLAISTKNLMGIQAQVVLVLDISKSMNKLYKTGVMQTVIERILALALNFDDDGNIDLFLFGTQAYQLPAISAADFSDYVERVILSHYKIIEATNYAPPLNQILEKYKNSQLPVFVVFITDGGNADKKETETIIRALSKLPIFIQFVGIGKEDFPFLHKLDELSGRVLDNAGFMTVEDVANISEAELYDRLLNEFPAWLKNARELKII